MGVERWREGGLVGEGRVVTVGESWREGGRAGGRGKVGKRLPNAQ